MIDENGVFEIGSSDRCFADREGVFLSGVLILGRTVYDGCGWLDAGVLPLCESNSLIRSSAGRFLLIQSCESTVRVTTDSSGSESLFYYQCGDRWVISNSLIAVVESVRKRGWPLSLNEESLATLFINHSIGRTLFSPQTVYNEVRLIPVDYSLEMDKATRVAKLVKVQGSKEINGDYRHGILEWCAKWRGIISALATRESTQPLVVDLSGGMDSRLILSLVLPLMRLINIRIHTHAHSPKDKSIARALALQFGFHVGSFKPQQTCIGIEQQFEKYMWGNLNYYHLPVKPAMSAKASDIVRINGIGGEVIRDFYPGTGVDWIEKVPYLLPKRLRKYGLGVKTLLKEAFSEFEIDPASPFSMREHYRQLRSRIHGGRRAHEKFKYKFVSPLTDSDFQRVAWSKNAPAAEGIFRDVLMIGGGVELASHPFDEPGKNFSPSFCRASAFFRTQRDALDEKNIENFSYVSVGDGTTDVRPSSDSFWPTGGDVQGVGSLNERIGFEYRELLREGCHELLPAVFGKELLSNHEINESARRKEVREIGGLSCIVAGLKTNGH